MQTTTWLKYDPAHCWVSRTAWTVAGVLIAVMLLGFVVLAVVGNALKTEPCHPYHSESVCRVPKLSANG